MDDILKKTIRVTKCLLSYGIVQENVEKIVLEAFQDEILRYPVLYENNVHQDGAWLRNKNCKTCGMTIPERFSQCASCSNSTCRFCLQYECCPNCVALFSKKCTICNEIPSIPVICYLEKCYCKNLYCQTCLQDALFSREELSSCINCSIPFDVYRHHDRMYENSGFYCSPRHSTNFLDAKHGEISCPMQCGEKMLRINAQTHLLTCPKRITAYFRPAKK
jgi:hypothetical protein